MILNGVAGTPCVSIVVPIFNSEKTLEACVQSITGQPFTDFELILVNDGSTDSSPDIMEQLKGQDARIHCVSQANQGLPMARNAGLAVARGRYVAFVDSDDLVHPDFFVAAFGSVPEREFDLFVTGMHRFVEEKIGAEQTAQAIGYEQLLTLVFCSNYVGLSVCNKIFRRQLLLDHYILFRPVKFAEDLVFMSEFLGHVTSAIYDPRPLYIYEEHAESITNSSKTARVFKDRDYEILKALDLSEQTPAFRERPVFRSIFSVRSVRSALRLMLLMLWCRVYNPDALVRAHRKLRVGAGAYLHSPHVSLSFKALVALFLLTPAAVLTGVFRMAAR